MRKTDIYFVLILSLLIGVFFYSRSLAHPVPVPLAGDLSTFPERIGEWVGEDVPIGPTILQVVGADSILNRAYRSPDGELLWLYVGYYQTQQKGAQIHSPLHCYPGSGWTPVQKDVVAVPVGTRKIYVNRMVIENGPRKRLVTYWYQAQGRVIANEYLQRFDLLRRALLQHRTNGVLVRISMPITTINPPEKAWKRMRQVLQETYPLLLQHVA